MHWGTVGAKSLTRPAQCPMCGGDSHRPPSFRHHHAVTRHQEFVIRHQSALLMRLRQACFIAHHLATLYCVARLVRHCVARLGCGTLAVRHCTAPFCIVGTVFNGWDCTTLHGNEWGCTALHGIVLHWVVRLCSAHGAAFHNTESQCYHAGVRSGSLFCNIKYSLYMCCAYNHNTSTTIECLIGRTCV